MYAGIHRRYILENACLYYPQSDYYANTRARAVLPARDPNARYLMECLMAPVKKETLKMLSELRELLQAKTDEELFNEPVEEDLEKRKTYGENILTYTFRDLWKRLEWYTSLYAHCGFPVRTQGARAGLSRNSYSTYT